MPIKWLALIQIGELQALRWSWPTVAEKSDIGSQEATVHVLNFPRSVARVSLSGWRNLIALCNGTTYLETHGFAMRRCLCN